MPLWEILFLIWAKCERNENASSSQDMAKKTCLRRFRLCQPYVITPGFFPAVTMPCPRPSAQWDCRWHGIAPRPTATRRPCWHVTFWRFLWTSQGDKSRWQKWLRVACVACLTPAPLRHLSSFVRQSPGWFGAFWVWRISISAMQGFTASALFSCTFCIRIRHLIRSA